MIQVFCWKPGFFLKTLGLFWGYLTSEMVETFIAFSKWLVTRTTGVSVIAYKILGTGQLLIIFLINGLCWLLVKWQIVLLSYKHEQEKLSNKKVWKCSYTKEKQCRKEVSCSYQTDLQRSNLMYGIEENREAVRCHLASLAFMKTL